MKQLVNKYENGRFKPNNTEITLNLNGLHISNKSRHCHT